MDLLGTLNMLPPAAVTSDMPEMEARHAASPAEAPAPAPAEQTPTLLGGWHILSKDWTASTSEPWATDHVTTVINDYMNRYDLDGSTTYNSYEELRQLSINLVIKFDLDIEIDDADSLVHSAGNMEELCWDFNTTRLWFMKTFKPNRFWLQGDCSDSDEDSYGFLGEGTYKVRLSSDPFTDGRTFADVEFEFRVRFEQTLNLHRREFAVPSRDECKLFTRQYNDEALGYHNTTSEPYGLYEMRGSVNNSHNSIHFEKVYQYDKSWPKFVFDGQKDGIDTHVKGSWICEGEHCETFCERRQVGVSGTFTMIKNPRCE